MNLGDKNFLSDDEVVSEQIASARRLGSQMGAAMRKSLDKIAVDAVDSTFPDLCDEAREYFIHRLTCCAPFTFVGAGKVVRVGGDCQIDHVAWKEKLEREGKYPKD